MAWEPPPEPCVRMSEGSRISECDVVFEGLPAGHYVRHFKPIASMEDCDLYSLELKICNRTSEGVPNRWSSKDCEAYVFELFDCDTIQRRRRENQLRSLKTSSAFLCVGVAFGRTWVILTTKNFCNGLELWKPTPQRLQTSNPDLKSDKGSGGGIHQQSMSSTLLSDRKDSPKEDGTSPQLSGQGSSASTLVSSFRDVTEVEVESDHVVSDVDLECPGSAEHVKQNNGRESPATTSDATQCQQENKLTRKQAAKARWKAKQRESRRLRRTLHITPADVKIEVEFRNLSVDGESAMGGRDGWEEDVREPSETEAAFQRSQNPLKSLFRQPSRLVPGVRISGGLFNPNGP